MTPTGSRKLVILPDSKTKIACSSLLTDLVKGERSVNLIAGNVLEYCDLSTRLIARNDMRSFGSLLIVAVRPVEEKSKTASARGVNQPREW